MKFVYILGEVVVDVYILSFASESDYQLGVVDVPRTLKIRLLKNLISTVTGVLVYLKIEDSTFPWPPVIIGIVSVGYLPQFNVVPLNLIAEEF